MAVPKIPRQLRIVGLIILIVAWLVTLGALQQVVLSYQVISNTTTSPEPATMTTALAAIATLVCAGATLVCAGVITFLVRRRLTNRGNSARK